MITDVEESIEVERKFDLGSRTVKQSNKSYRIRQAYIGEPSEDMEVRVRQKTHIRTDDRPDVVEPTEHTLTVKAGTPPTRMERTQEISSEVFYSIFERSGLVVEKVRHEFLIDDGNLLLEVDQFEYPVELTMAEIEFENEEQAQAFDPSEHGLGEVTEVTGDPEYTNQQIARR